MSSLEPWLNSFGRQALEKAGRQTWLRDIVDTGKATIKPDNVINAIYDAAREANYPASPRYAANIEAITSSATAETEVWEQNKCHYRVPKNRAANGWSTNDTSIDRVSLNVYAEPELIQKLDGLMTRHKAYYKTYDESVAWA